MKSAEIFQTVSDSFGDPIIKVLLAALAINILFLFRNLTGAIRRHSNRDIPRHLCFHPFGIRANRRLQSCRGRRAGQLPSAGRMSQVPISDVVTGDIVLLKPANGFRRTAY